MQEKVLYNVLRQIQRNEQPTGSPDSQYLKALETIGMITLGWDITLTSFGHDTLRRLENKFY